MSGNGLFANWLKRRRKSLDLTREALAKRANCSVSTLRRLEAGDLRPGKQLAESLAAALDIPSDQREAFVRFARGDANQFSESAAPIPNPQYPIANLSSPISTLRVPAPLTSLVGRKKEVADVCGLLREPGVRLLTLTGPPGIGKTRLSIAVASELITSDAALFPDGAHFVSLAPISDPDLVASVIAETLDVRESPSRSLLDSLREFLRSKRMLLVLDNLEQVLKAALLVTDLLTAAPGVKALVTSREVLRVYGEHEYPIPPLSLPDVNRLPTTLARSFYAQYSSIELFRDRARAARADFALTPDNLADVARICAWLDGLPLAIEMAAAQVKWLPTDKLFDQLSHRLAALTGGPRDLSPRQQSLSGAIDWSYHLLSDDEKRLFDVLGIFVGGCDEEAISEVWQCSDPKSQISNLKFQVRNLVDKSLLHYEMSKEGQPRYVMLETIRDYARDRLRQRGEFECVQQAHAEHFFRLAQTARPYVMGGNEQLAWATRIEAEHNNLRAALAWAMATPMRGEWALQLAEALYHFWYLRGYLSEGRKWLEVALALNDSPTELRARVLNYAGQIARVQGDWSRSQAWQEQAMSIQTAIGDEQGLCRSLDNMAILAGSQGKYALAGELLERVLTLRRKLNDTQYLASTLNNLALVSHRLGNLRRADQLYGELAAFARERDDTRLLSYALQGLGELAVERQTYPEALVLLREGLAIRYELGHIAQLDATLEAIALVYHRLGDSTAAVTLFSACDKLRQELGVALSLANRTEQEEHLADMRAQLGHTAFERAWDKGQAMSRDEAIKLAQGT